MRVASAVRPWVLLFLASATPAAAVNVFTVNSTADPGTGGCNVTECTLREAITSANATANSGGPDEIRFSIAGAGPHRILLASVLPAVTTAMSIQGYTQPGAAANTLAVGSNAQIKVIVDSINFTNTVSSTLTLSAAGADVSGLAFVNKGTPGPLLLSQNAQIHGCWIGVEPDGTTLGINGTGVSIDGSSGIGLLGGPNLADRNVIAGVSGNAIGMVTLTGARVENNLIGLKPDGITPASVNVGVFASVIANGQEFVNNTVACATNGAISNFGTLVTGNRIGTTADGNGTPSCTTVGVQINTTLATRVADNRVAHTSTRAIAVASSARNVVLSGNRIYDNASGVVPLDLSANGHTGNDTGDADTGANNLQNFPLLTDVRRVSADTVSLSGTLNSLANTRFRLEFFSSERVDDGSINLNLEFGDADRVATASIDVTTDANGNASFGPQDISFGGTGFIAAVAATATRLDASANPVETSEIGPLRAAYTPGSTSFVVTNTETGGSGSFKQAWLEADAHPDAGSTRDRISFAIPGNGPHTITVAGLTTIISSGRLEIDGSTQTGWQANTATIGSNAQLPIDISGVKLALNNSPDTLLRGVVLRGPSALLSMGAGVVEGSFIGVSQDGNALATTQGNTAQLNCGGACRIGGSAPAQRNLITADSNSITDTVHITGAGAVVEGNVIGLRRDGLTRLMVPNPPTGVQFATGIALAFGSSGAQIRNNSIGGFMVGIRTEGGNPLVEDNRVGVGDDGITAAGNIGSGIHVSSGQARVQHNLIANNTRDGILVGGPGSLSALTENTLRNNGELGIDLDVTGVINGDGVTPNDVGDPDIGGNNGQNHPLLSAVTRDASSVTANVSLNGLANTTFRIRYCLIVSADPSGRGECDIPVVGIVQTLVTDASGNASGTSPSLPYTAGAIGLTATAGRVAGAFEETSEFSPVVPILVRTALTIDADQPDPSTVGQPFNVTVSVASADAALTATGGVAVTAAGAGSCNAVLVAGTGSCQLTGTAAGATSIVASYAGNGSFAPSTLSTAHTITPAASSTLISADTPDPSTFGDAVTVSVQVSSSAGTPGGNVLISDGLGAQCTASLSNGLGSCALTPAQGGAITLTADYQGAANFLTSNDGEPHQVVAVASSIAILADTPDPSVSGQPVNVSAALSSSVGTPIGPIIISDSAGASCQISGAQGSCNLMPINAGAITLRADFAGNATHLASTTGTAHQVDRAATATSTSPPFPPAAPTAPPRQFAALRFPVGVLAQAPGSGAPTGTISVQVSAGVESCVVNLPATECDLVPQAAGLRTYQIDYSGDSRFLPSTTTIEVNVLPDRLYQDGFDLDEI